MNKLLMRNNNNSNDINNINNPTSNSNSIVLNDSMRSRKSIGTVGNNSNNHNSVVFNDSGKVSRKSTPSNNIIGTAINHSSNVSNNSHSHHHPLDSSSGHVRAFEAMLSDLQIFPSDNGTRNGNGNGSGNDMSSTGVSVHKRIPGWKLTRGSDRREALVQSLLAATGGVGGTGGGGDAGRMYGRSSRPATTTQPPNNDRILAPGRLLGVGVGVETLPIRTHSQPVSRSQYNSRASPPPSPPRSIAISNNNNNRLEHPHLLLLTLTIAIFAISNHTITTTACLTHKY